MSQHTAGPWFVVGNGSQIDVHARIAPVGEDIREISIARNLGSIHDAHLIAAAPELLHALILLYESAQLGMRPGIDIMTKAGAAIAKATE